MKSSRTPRRQSHDYLQTPHSNRQKLKEKQKLSQDIKAKYIQELQQRNRKLKYQIIKINQMLQQQNQKPQKKQHKLIPTESSAQVVKKQLQNVYKQIKNYQRQINNLQQKQAGGLLTQKMARLQNIYNQKTGHLQKLKNQLSQLTKNSLDNSKKLKNNAGKQQLQNTMLKYNQQIKLLRQKVRQAQNRQKKKMDNAKKQFDYIKKLQRQLIQNGVSIDQLEDIKKNNIFNQIYEKIGNGGNNTSLQKPSKNNNNNNNNNKNQQKQSKQEIQQLTPQRFLEMKNQIKLFKKLHMDYDKRLELLEKEKIQEQRATAQSKIKLNQKQQQIARLQNQIAQLKGKVKKVNLKPNYTKPTKQEQKKKPQQKIRMLPQKPNKQTTSNSATDQTHLKYDQKGQVSDKGSRFTDRVVLGKNFNSRIVGIKVWTQKSSFQICGIQCIYRVGDQIRSGPQHIAIDIKLSCTQNVMELLDGDYVKSISGNLSQNNIIQYLVIMSKDSQVARFGVVKPTQKQFNFDIQQDQIPICLYGSLQQSLTGKKQLSLIQQIGFEITRDKGFNKDQKFI